MNPTSTMCINLGDENALIWETGALFWETKCINLGDEVHYSGRRGALIWETKKSQNCLYPLNLQGVFATQNFIDSIKTVFKTDRQYQMLLHSKSPFRPEATS